jgi:mannitol/fructose-specific phosphotransferase system IIA component (Ntr-type)
MGCGMFSLEFSGNCSRVAGMSYLSELLRIEQIQLKLKGADKAAVLGEMVALVPEVRGNTAQSGAFLQSLLEREKLHTTGIGEGIALPHARNPLAGVLKRPLLVFGRHTPGVAYGALDNKPVQLLFLLASPNLTDHLAMLARISRVLRDSALRQGLLTLQRVEEVPKLIAEAEARVIK